MKPDESQARRLPHTAQCPHIVGASGRAEGAGIWGATVTSVSFHTVPVFMPQGFCIFGVQALKAFLLLGHFGSLTTPRSLLQLIKFVLL